MAGRERCINDLIEKRIDPAWSSLNLTRIDGSECSEAIQALEEARTAPFGLGEKIVLVNNSPFLNGCSNQLASLFEEAITLIPTNTHLILNNTNKPDGRIKTTKAIQKLVKSNLCR